jgi:putative sigma-54 modulation protein
LKLEVRSKGVEPSEALRRYLEKRLARLGRYLDGIEVVQVLLRLERGRHVVEVTIPLDGLVLRAEEQTGDMYTSVDLVVEKLEKQIAKYKTRLFKRTRSQSLRDRAEGEAPGSEAEATEEEVPQIVKVKRFAIKPMSVEEAILQMNLLGHNFFVFANAETEQVNVVYRRRDGNYGLIEPE